MDAGPRARECRFMVRDIVTLVARFLSKIKPLGLLGLLGALLLASSHAQAQGVTIPNFWDPKAQLDRPELPATRTIRFLVDDDFPPLAFPGLGRQSDRALRGTGPGGLRAPEPHLHGPGPPLRYAPRRPGRQAGRRGGRRHLRYGRSAAALCRHGTLFQDPGPLRRAQGPQPAALPRPGRCRARRSASSAEPPTKPSRRLSWQAARSSPIPELAAAQAALKAGEIDYLFADGLGLALWIGGEDAGGCCDFSGGPYLESRFFGEGIGFITRTEDETSAPGPRFRPAAALERGQIRRALPALLPHQPLLRPSRSREDGFTALTLTGLDP